MEDARNLGVSHRLEVIQCFLRSELLKSENVLIDAILHLFDQLHINITGLSPHVQSGLDPKIGAITTAVDNIPSFLKSELIRSETLQIDTMVNLSGESKLALASIHRAVQSSVYTSFNTISNGISNLESNFEIHRAKSDNLLMATSLESGSVPSDSFAAIQSTLASLPPALQKYIDDSQTATILSI